MSDYQPPDAELGFDSEPNGQVLPAAGPYDLFHRLFDRGDVALVVACFAIEARTNADHQTYRYWTDIFHRLRPNRDCRADSTLK